MDRLLYVAMSGAQQTFWGQAANSHNLANATTPGFKADIVQTRSMPVYGTVLPTRVFAMTERPGVDFRAGAVQRTGRDLDVAVDGEGWIAVQAADGGEGYTRAGDLRLNTNGLLETGAGLLVLGNAGPVAVPPSESLDIAPDGTISIRPVGQDSKTLAQVDRIKLVQPPLADMYKDHAGLFRLKQGNLAPPDGRVRLVSGALEASNVNAVQAMVDMIAMARRFEMQVKMMHAAEEAESASVSVMRMA